MNSSIIRYILGSVLKLEGALMALPCLVSVIYKEKEGLSYLAVALGCLVFGFLLTFKKPKDTVFYPDSPQPEQPYLTMWNRYPIRRCSGEALPTG